MAPNLVLLAVLLTVGVVFVFVGALFVASFGAQVSDSDTLRLLGL